MIANIVDTLGPLPAIYASAKFADQVSFELITHASN